MFNLDIASASSVIFFCINRIRYHFHAKVEYSTVSLPMLGIQKWNGNLKIHIRDHTQNTFLLIFYSLKKCSKDEGREKLCSKTSKTNFHFD